MATQMDWAMLGSWSAGYKTALTVVGEGKYVLTREPLPVEDAVRADQAALRGVADDWDEK